MRLIFIVLLVANIIFFGFEFFGARSSTSECSVLVRVPHNFGNLLLLAERDANKTTSKKKQADGASDSVSGEVEKCQLIGPFVELLHAEYLLERLKALDVAAEIKHIEIADGKSYWVYLKPEMSEKEALRRLYEIQAKSIDAFIIPSGELANGISFGQFGSEKEADDRVEQIRNQGYSAEIKELPKSHSEVWVEVKEKSEQKINDEHWLELLKEEKAIERRQNYCLGVAK